MLFCDFIRITVLLIAAVATALIAVTAVLAARADATAVMILAAIWWPLAAGIGAYLGRDSGATSAISEALSRARMATVLSSTGPWRVILSRLWPLAVFTVAVAGVAWLWPQVAAIAAGFAILTALGWRKQEAAVAAIEQRDGVRFYLESSPAWEALRVVRAPGFSAGR